MPYRYLASGLSLLLAIVGIAFAGWGPLLLPLFGVSFPADSSIDLLRLAGFVRMFGIALVCLAAALWVIDHRDTTAGRGGLGVLGAAFLLASALALTQQIAIWNTPAGMVLVVVLASIGSTFTYAGVGERRSAN